jgi:hypothetical protein
MDRHPEHQQRAARATLMDKISIAGEYFLEVFEVSSGRRVFSIESRFCNFQADTPVQRLDWLSENWLIVDMHPDKDHLLFCNMEKQP